MRWRTRHLEQCYELDRFGLTQDQFDTRPPDLGVASEVELIDRRLDGSSQHRLWGPWEIISPEPLPQGATPKHLGSDGRVVIYRVSPDSDPIHGWGSYPYRFHMQRKASFHRGVWQCTKDARCCGQG